MQNMHGNARKDWGGQLGCWASSIKEKNFITSVTLMYCQIGISPYPSYMINLVQSDMPYDVLLVCKYIILIILGMITVFLKFSFCCCFK